MARIRKLKQNPACPHCLNNDRVRKHGLSHSRLQRYLCRGCGLTFQTHFIYEGRRDVPPAKASTMTLNAKQYGQIAVGKAPALIDSVTTRAFLNLHCPPPTCPFCQRCAGIRKNGKAPSGLMRYYCNACRRSFQLNYIYPAYRVHRDTGAT